MKKTLVLGASDNPSRYAYLAVESLLKSGHEVVAIGKSESKVFGQKILTGQPAVEQIDTITLYLNAKNQQPYYDYILSLNPKRIIFNPGAENQELEKLAKAKGIETLKACTLVMLSNKLY